MTPDKRDTRTTRDTRNTLSALRPYLAIVSARFRMLLQYRAAAFAGVWTQLFFGLVFLGVYEAFYRSSNQTPPMAFSQVVSYVWLGQAFWAMLPWNADAEVRAMVRSGAVAYELCRPVDLYGLWYARAMAWRTAPTMLRAAPMCVIAACGLPLIGLEEWRLAPPASFESGVAFAATLVCTLLLGCALTTLINITLLWTLNGEGIAMLMAAMVTFFSGMIIPLPLFPDWSQPIVQALPFAGLVDLPFRVFTGHIPPHAAVGVLQHQLLWTAALVLAGRWLLSRGMRRIVVQGG
jgi:ABC-2 type transport system permease protein